MVALATGAAVADGRPWYLPDHAKLQFAGSIGFISPGVGWAWGGRKVEADVFLGWVPEVVGGEDIYSATGKLAWQPLSFGGARGWLVRPVSAGLQVTYTFGSRYFVRQPSRFGPDYYDFPTALRTGVALGGNAAIRTRGAVREIGVYWEVVALDVMLFLWARNPRALGPEDAFTVALGVRAGF